MIWAIHPHNEFGALLADNFINQHDSVISRVPMENASLRTVVATLTSSFGTTTWFGF